MEKINFNNTFYLIYLNISQYILKRDTQIFHTKPLKYSVYFTLKSQLS